MWICDDVIVDETAREVCKTNLFPDQGFKLNFLVCYCFPNAKQYFQKENFFEMALPLQILFAVVSNHIRAIKVFLY